MKPEFYFYCYPWDLEDEGLDASLGRLAGEIGVDSICVAATESEIRMIRGRNFGERRTFVCAAAAHFQPAPEIHRGNRMQPSPAGWMKTRNALYSISCAAEKEGLVVRAKVVCCEGAQAAKRYPHAACINVFGDASDNRICPAQPDVRQYVSCVVEDLTKNYPIKTIELSEIDYGIGDRCAWYSHASAPSMPLRRMSSAWCFCSVCKQRAFDSGVDADAIRTAILAALDKLMSTDGFSLDALDELTPRGPEVVAYERLRCEAVTDLVRSASSKSLRPLRVHTLWVPELGGTSVARVSEFCDGIITPIADFDGGELAQEEIDAAGGPSRCDAVLWCYPPSAKDGPSFVALVHRAAQRGFNAIGFEEYGLAPAPCLDWVRQAIRYARRESK